MSRSIFFLQAEDGIRAGHVTGVQTCALPISKLKARPAGMLVLPGSHRFVGEDASETRRNEMTQGVLYIHSAPRSEERRVGKEYRTTGARDKKNNTETTERKRYYIQ